MKTSDNSWKKIVWTGTDMPEDTTIPLIILDRGIKFDLPCVNIKDITPTVTSLLGVSADEDREGECLLKQE